MAKIKITRVIREDECAREVDSLPEGYGIICSGGWWGYSTEDMPEDETVPDIPTCDCGGLAIDNTGNLHSDWCRIYDKVILAEGEK